MYLYPMDFEVRNAFFSVYYKCFHLNLFILTLHVIFQTFYKENEGILYVQTERNQHLAAILITLLEFRRSLRQIFVTAFKE